MFFTLSNVLVDRASEDLFQYWEVFYASALTAAEDLIKFIFLVKEFKVKTTKKIKHRYSWRTKIISDSVTKLFLLQSRRLLKS